MRSGLDPPPPKALHLNVDTTHDPTLELLQERLTHRFKNPALLERALTHPSILQDDPSIKESNQRLEFLGDAVLQLVLTEELFKRFPEEREGPLSKHRSILTRGTYQAELARKIGIAEALYLSSSEENTGGRQKAGALEDAFEALLGAVYLDSDFETTRRIILALFGDLSVPLTSAAANDYASHENPKGLLQERVQPTHGNGALRYELTATTGEDHNRCFEVSVFLLERQLGSGSGPSKKTAEIMAARASLRLLDQDEKPST